LTPKFSNQGKKKRKATRTLTDTHKKPVREQETKGRKAEQEIDSAEGNGLGKGRK
jgi:hypothetical protein